MTHTHQEGMKRFINHIIRFSGEIGVGSQVTSKVERAEGDWFWAFIMVRRWN